MTRESRIIIGDEHIGPYMVPEYWEGHGLGIGDITTADEAYTIPSGYRRIAKTAINDYLNLPSPTRFSLRAYEQGETFNPSDYDPGTIVAFHYEQLNACSNDLNRLKRRKAPLDLEGVRPAIRVTSLPRTKDLAYTTRWVHDDEKAYVYFSCAMWGVIASHPRKKAQLLHVNSAFIDYRPPETWVNEHIYAKSDQVIVGAMRHVRPHADRERLQRINALEVCSYEMPTRQKASWLFSLFGRAALGRG